MAFYLRIERRDPYAQFEAVVDSFIGKHDLAASFDCLINCQ